ncbi:PAS domain-containing protein [Marinoscillum pacificum]|uniref:PAS domain-containing protein n=1 Tax=Marinoscillum pacificum TaxID=392723 RepID=UPI002157CE9B|nr:PAS domain-containing protein [Marinoscillum pacificum]
MSNNTGIDHLAIYREIFDHSSESIMLLDEHGLITLANQSARDLFETESLEGKPITDFFIGEILLNTNSEHIINGFPYRIKAEVLSKSPFRSIHFTPLYQSPDPTKWFSDISDFFPEPMWIINKEYQLVNYNKAFKDDVETFRKKTIKKGDNVLYPEYDPGYLKFWKNAYQHAFKGIEKKYNFERPDPTNGKYYSLIVTPIKKKKTVIGAACYTRDISDFITQNQKLEIHSQKLQKAFDMALMAEWEYNFTTKTFWWISKTPDLLKIRSESLPVHWNSFIELVHPDFKERVIHSFDSIQSSNFFKIDVKMTFDKSHYIWVKLYGTGVEENPKEGLKLIGIIQNINSRKLAELQLIESENRYRELIGVAPAIIFQYNITADIGLFYSGKAKEILGYTVEQLVRTKNFWPSKFHPDDKQRLIDHAMGIKPGDTRVIEYRIQHKDGHWVWLKEYSIDVKSIKGQTIYTGMAFDITKEKENKIRLNLALESANLGVYEHDLITDEFIMDDKLLALVGYERNELPLTYQEIIKVIIHPDEQQRSEKIPKEAMESGMSDIAVTYNKLLHKSGKTLFIETYTIVSKRDPNNNPVEVIGTVVDISESKQQEFRLHEANQSLQKIIESVPGVVFRFPLDFTACPDFVSDQIENLTGYSAEEFYREDGIKYVDLINDHDLDLATTEIYKAAEENRGYEISYRLNHRSGLILWVWERGGFVEIDGKIYIEGFMTDITDKVRVEDRIISATLKAEDAERSRISRDIHDGLQQTLVSSLFTFQELQTRVGPLINDELNNLFTNALETLQNGVAETRLIAHSIMPKSIQDFGLIETLEYMIENLNRSSTTSFRLFHNLDDDNISPAEATSLYRICQEATNNILKYARSTEVEIQLMKHNNTIILSIDDNGIGFDTKKTDMLFTGLGFSSMKSRANAISATFELHSIPGKGTSIIVEMPYESN